jgi:hypothetical protein
MGALSACEIVVRPDSARPALPAVAGFSYLGDAVAKRGRPRKLEGKRKPCGRLSPSLFDEGHPMTLQHRAAAVGENPDDPGHKAHSRFAGYVLGRLYLAGAFGADDKLAERRHDLLARYASAHRAIFGAATAQSAMRDLVGTRGRSPAGDADPLAGLYAKLKVWYAALMILPPSPGCRVLTHQVVERAVLYEMAPATAPELHTLVRAADRLLELDGARVGRDGSRKPAADHGSPGRRRPDLLAIYSRDVFGPSDEDLAAALAKYRLLPPSGEAG